MASKCDEIISRMSNTPISIVGKGTGRMSFPTNVGERRALNALAAHEMRTEAEQLRHMMISILTGDMEAIYRMMKVADALAEEEGNNGA